MTICHLNAMSYIKCSSLFKATILYRRQWFNRVSLALISSTARKAMAIHLPPLLDMPMKPSPVVSRFQLGCWLTVLKDPTDNWIDDLNYMHTLPLVCIIRLLFFKVRMLSAVYLMHIDCVTKYKFSYVNITAIIVLVIWQYFFSYVVVTHTESNCYYVTVYIYYACKLIGSIYIRGLYLTCERQINFY